MLLFVFFPYLLWEKPVILCHNFLRSFHCGVWSRRVVDRISGVIVYLWRKILRKSRFLAKILLEIKQLETEAKTSNDRSITSAPGIRPIDREPSVSLTPSWGRKRIFKAVLSSRGGERKDSGVLAGKISYAVSSQLLFWGECK